MSNVKINGRVKKCELKNRKPYRPSYYCQGEQLEFYLDLEIETEEGSVYLKTPAARRVVTMGGPIAVVVYTVSGKAETWMREEGDRAVAEAGKPNNNKLIPFCREGDEVEIEARLKCEKVSRKGNPYRVVTHAKLVAVNSKAPAA